MTSNLEQSRPSLLFVVGPTGVGKTALSLALATQLDGEIINIDSQQVYRGMDIGTGKVSAVERGSVPHHLLDVVDPDDEMTAGRYVALADAAIMDIAARGKNIIICGGTGLYVRTLLLGLFDGPPADDSIRAEIQQQIFELGAAAVHQRLAAVDPEVAARIDANDHKRVIRALEVFQLTGVRMSEHQAKHNFRTLAPRYPHRLIGLATEREAMNARIDQRVVEMFEAGLVQEVEGLRQRGYGPTLRSQGAIGYAEVHVHLDGGAPLDATIALVQRNSRQYARRQLSWYRPNPDVEWHTGAQTVDVGELRRYLMDQRHV
jgi:tRNA dimethylallyltransferase